jgi:hypothetical protein
MGTLVVSLLMVLTGLATDDGFVERARRADEAKRALAASVDPEERGRQAWIYLHALMAALETAARPSGRNQETPEPYRTWLRAHADEIHSNPLGREWQVRLDWAWALHASVGKTPIAEPIAWKIVSIGMSGECEGDMECYLGWDDRLYGEYLRRHPDGSHVGAALEQFTEELPHYRDLVIEPYMFEPAKECAVVLPQIRRLQAAIAKTSMRGATARVLEDFDRLARICPHR